MTDILKMEHINSLPQPFLVRFCGDKEWWPVYDIGVDVPVIRVDVFGKLERRAFAEAAEIEDADGNMHNPDDWYNEDAAQ